MLTATGVVVNSSKTFGLLSIMYCVRLSTVQTQSAEERTEKLARLYMKPTTGTELSFVCSFGLGDVHKCFNSRETPASLCFAHSFYAEG